MNISSSMCFFKNALGSKLLPGGHSERPRLRGDHRRARSSERLEGQQPSQREERRRQSAEDGILVIFRLGELS
jgi:hypothetical protein